MPLPIYQLRSMSQWQSGKPLAGAPNTTATQGYDVRAPISPGRKLTQRRANGYLSDGKYYWPLFVSGVGIDFSLAGSTAQSIRTRDFYPRNLVQPSYVVQGQALDQEDYGLLCEYVRHLQAYKLLSRSGHPGTPQPLMQLNISGQGADGTRTSGLRVTYTGQFGVNYSQIIRGSHSAVVAQGYVDAMPRQHQRSVYAPTYTLTFVVARMIIGPWSEIMVDAQKQKSWVDIVRSAQQGSALSGKKGNHNSPTQLPSDVTSATPSGANPADLSVSTTPANIEQAQSYLDYAAKHAGNIINTGG